MRAGLNRTAGAGSPSGTLFVMPKTTIGQIGPVAVWITAAGLAAAARRRWGESWLVAPRGVFSPEQALARATDPDRDAPDRKPFWRRRFPALGTARSDLRSRMRAHRFRNAGLRGPWESSRLAFVWQHHELFQRAGFRAARRHGAPLVLFVDAPIVWEAEQWRVRRPGWGRLLERWGEKPQFRDADLVVCVSLEVADQVRVLGARPERILVAPCAVDLDRFKPTVSGRDVRSRYDLEGRFVVGWSGSFRRFHGVDLAIEAMGSVARALPGAVLLLVGDGPERRWLEEKARRLNLLPNVVFTGPVSYSDMPAHVAAMDVGLVIDPALGKYHYSPLKSWEYMAAGKAIVSPTSGQMKRVLQDGHDALLVEPGAAEPIASAVLRLHADPELRASLQIAARARVAADGSWDHRLRTIEDALIARGLLPVPELELAPSAQAETKEGRRLPPQALGSSRPSGSGGQFGHRA